MSVSFREVKGGFIKIMPACIRDEKYMLNNACGQKPAVCFVGQAVSNVHWLRSVSKFSCPSSLVPLLYSVRRVCSLESQRSGGACSEKTDEGSTNSLPEEGS